VGAASCVGEGDVVFGGELFEGGDAVVFVDGGGAFESCAGGDAKHAGDEPGDGEAGCELSGVWAVSDGVERGV